jgi:hypothetical protein
MPSNTKLLRVWIPKHTTIKAIAKRVPQLSVRTAWYPTRQYTIEKGICLEKNKYLLNKSIRFDFDIRSLRLETTLDFSKYHLLQQVVLEQYKWQVCR